MKNNDLTDTTFKIPTNYLPKLLYFFQLTKLGAPIEAHENFVKGTLRNRCYILSDKGVERLSVPISRFHGQKTVITQVGVDYTQNWNIKQLRAIKSYYANAPYFEHFFDPIESLLTTRYDNLFELNTQSTLVLGKLLGLELDLKFTTDFIKEDAPSDGFIHPRYYQVFSEKMEFQPELSALDYLFCEGRLRSF